MTRPAAFGIGQSKSAVVEILVWIWQGQPVLQKLRSESGGFQIMNLRARPVETLTEFHVRCPNEVALAGAQLPRILAALRELLEVEILRGNLPAPAEDEMCWKLAHTWMAGNLAIHAPVPALCDYLRMSPSTLHRFFPGATAHPRGRLAGQDARLSPRLSACQQSQSCAGGQIVRKAGRGNPRK